MENGERQGEEGVFLVQETVYSNLGDRVSRHGSRSQSGTTQPRSKSVKSSREPPDTHRSSSKRRSRTDGVSSGRQNRYAPPQATANPQTEHTSRDDTRAWQDAQSDAHHSWHDSRSGPIQRLLDDVFSCDTGGVQYRSVMGREQRQRPHRRHRRHGSREVSRTQDVTQGE